MTGLNYYGARYYDSVAGQFTSADTTLAGGLNRYGYVGGNPETATDPTGHMYVRPTGGGSSSSGSSSSGSSSSGSSGGSSSGGSSGGGNGGWGGALLSFGWQALDATTGIPSMISDVQTLFNSDASLTSKLFAGADLALNVFMDVTMVIGVGEGLRAAYEGVRIGVHVAADVAEHAAEHDIEASVEHAGEHAAEQGAEDLAGQMADGSACGLSFAAATLVATPSGERPIASLKVGDHVTAYDPTTGKMTTQTVVRMFLNHDHDRLDITLALPTSSAPASATTTSQPTRAAETVRERARAVAGHGLRAPPDATTTTTSATTTSAATATATTEVIHTTANHPWLSADHGWELAGDLRVGEPVRLLDGGVATVVALQALPGVGPMWDLSLDDVHTFAVGNVQAVVHNCNSGKVKFDDKQVTRKYGKHAGDFGVTGANNGTNRAKFVDAMKAHLDDPNTFERQGTISSDKPGGTPAIHYYNSNTGLNVTTDMQGNFISGWKLSPFQSWFVVMTGVLR